MPSMPTAYDLPTKPGWHTDVLDEEWIEPPISDDLDHTDDKDVNQPSRSVRSRATSNDRGSIDFHTSNDQSSTSLKRAHSPLPPSSPTAQGTFLIREDQPVAPIMPMQARKGRIMNIMKDFFSPLALETMFEPPSPKLISNDDLSVRPTHVESEGKNNELDDPPQEPEQGLGEADMDEETRPVPHDLPEGVVEREELDEEDVIVASDIPNLSSFNGRKLSVNYKFTFAAARPPRIPSRVPEAAATTQTPSNAKSINTSVPQTDSRLRLFQFQYDTFTRDHLSAVVDSIAVHSPSESSKSKSPRHVLSRSQAQNLSPQLDQAYLRATKRLRLTPPSNDESQAIPNVVPKPRKDYIGESRKLMRKIKQSRSPSMMTILSMKETAQQGTSVGDLSTVQGSTQVPDRDAANDILSSHAFSDATSNVKIDMGSPTPSSSQPYTIHSSASLHPVYPTSTLTPSVPSSLFSSTSGKNSKPGTIASALGYRAKAADLMAQIRQDMTQGKRLFSLESTKERTLAVDERERAPYLVSDAPTNPVKPPISPQKKTASTSGVSLPSSSSDGQTVVVSSSDGQTAFDTTKLEKPPIPRKYPKPSPRKLLRRLSAADEVDRELAMNKSLSEAISSAPSITSQKPVDLTIKSDSPPAAAIHLSRQSQIGHSVPQSEPVQAFSLKINTSLSNRTGDVRSLQLPPTGQPPNRVVSGGTATSSETVESALTRGTTATSATSVITVRTASTGSVDSAASFVKHPGPVQMTRIKPEDVPALPEMVGGMRFDRTLMRWVKAGPSKNRIANNDEGVTAVSEESEDPFRSFESLDSGDGDGTEKIGNIQRDDVAQGDEQETASAGDDDEDLINDHLSFAALVSNQDDTDTDDSFDFGNEPEAAIVEVMTGVDSLAMDSELQSTDSETDQLLEFIDGGDADEVQDDDTVEMLVQQAAAATASSHVDSVVYSTPLPPHRTALAPPRSVLKNASGLLTPRMPCSVTPIRNNVVNSAHKRSVSFSDGRTDGKIEGIGRNNTSKVISTGSMDAGVSPFSTSVRGHRIASILEDLVDPLEETPSKASNTSRRDGIQPLAPRTQFSRLPFSRSRKEKELSLAQANQTFLTECSFGIAHDNLVHIITDIHPYVPHWETLERIDLSNKGIESLVRLKEVLPQLDVLNINGNALPWVTGVPKSVRTLSASSNLLTAMTSFNHLSNLENLDISNNHLDSVRQLSCLRHLRELKADGNAITSLEGLGELDSLTKLSLRDNRISHIDFRELRWSRLELLNLSRNNLQSISGLSSLLSLSALNLDHNHLVSLEAEESLPKLLTLRVSNNRLTFLDVACFSNLRTLYADNNRLCDLLNARRLRKLENLSLRNQGGTGLTLTINNIRDVKRLYLSGNPLPYPFLTEPCYNLIYLELAACRLERLPPDLLRLIPNIRVLNLNYNFLADASALDGLRRLRKLTLIGSRLKGTKSLVRALRRMPEIEMVDFRMNPCTLGWYLPILVHDVPGALQPSDNVRHDADKKHHDLPNRECVAGSARVGSGGSAASAHSAPPTWQELDAKFRCGLPDEAYVGRLAYRGLVMRACPKVRMLDGIVVEAGERKKAEGLLQGVLSAKTWT